MIAVQSVVAPPAVVRSGLIEFDTILLSVAMFALGVGTRWSQIKRAGTRPLFLAAVLFADLVGGGFLLTRLMIG